MKYLVCLFALISFSSFAQDVIVKKNGEKIEAKVVEITSSTIKYKAHNQQDGPLRNINVNEVEEVIYEDGTWEKFNKPGGSQPSDTDPERTEPTRPSAKPPVKEDADPILESGFFFEGIIGPAFRTTTFQNVIEQYDPTTGFFTYTSVYEKRTDLYASISIRLGSKFYFGAREKWRPGLQVNYLRFGLMINDSPLESMIVGPKNFSFGNVGMTNAFKFTDKIGMEVNLNGGYNMEANLDDGYFSHGIAANLEAKFRYKRFGVGLDFMHVFGLSADPFGGTGNYFPTDLNFVGVSIGLKM